MASVKRIESSTVHKIQSGQVVVDLCSAVKELVENSIDAGSTSIDVRFRNYGLDAIEVQDNGSGIAKDDFESIALKHYTSKLTTYDDLEGLNTYGFRGEALSSLCAVSDLYITTARQDEAPQGSRLDFEYSGKIKSTTIVACQRGTTVHVENLFRNLIVRRKELEKNIKREYTKVLNLLQAYACICTKLRLSVSNTVAKQRKDVFRTKGNQSTQDNIANVFGARSLVGLIALDLKLKMTASEASSINEEDNIVKIVGHVSTPTYGGGRQTSDRQMFFVNSRPCSLPQFTKVFNEVYKSYNMSQSPFVFANIILDTSAYDVNVSPDKRTIMLHDQAAMLNCVRESLTDLFEAQQQSVPSAQMDRKLPSYKALSISRESTLGEINTRSATLSRTTTIDSDTEKDTTIPTQMSVHLISDFAARGTRLRPEPKIARTRLTEKQQAVMKTAEEKQQASGFDEFDDIGDLPETESPQGSVSGTEEESNEDVESSDQSSGNGAAAHVRAFNERLAEIKAREQEARVKLVRPTMKQPNSMAISATEEDPIPLVTTKPVKDTPGALPNAFDRLRPMRMQAETAVITVGDKTFTTTLGSQRQTRAHTHPFTKSGSGTKITSRSLKEFLAPGVRDRNDDDDDNDDDDNDSSSDNADSTIHQSRPEESIMSRPQREGQVKIIDPSRKPDSGNRGSGASESESLIQHRVLLESDNEGISHSDQSTSSSQEMHDDPNDPEYLDEDSKKAKEDGRVSRLIEEAEASLTVPSQTTTARVRDLSGRNGKDSTVKLNLNTSISQETICKQFLAAVNDEEIVTNHGSIIGDGLNIDDPSAEAQLSVNVSKSDFSKMRIVGQFNLGFIIAVRPTSEDTKDGTGEEIFIIDQHASDEKYNFERLQQITTLQNQQLVRPQTLDLTAVEEEILTNNTTALQANGFQISIDESGVSPVGRRCTLHALPTSREVTFTTTDLEELLSLLAVSEDTDILPTSTMSFEGKYVPRPSKVRKLFAMRACRSSIMIGKTLTKSQMTKLVQNMGTIDKPWNCPHGRPTMRHLRSLNGVREWLGQRGDVDDEDEIDWEGWL